MTSIEIEVTYASLYNRGTSFLALGDKGRSRVDFDQGLKRAVRLSKKDPTDFGIALDVALFAMAGGDVDRARKAYARSIEETDQLIPMLTAIRNLDQFISLFPEHEVAREMRELMVKAKHTHGSGSED